MVHNTRLIKNFDDIATSKRRTQALAIVEAGIGAIDTTTIIDEAIALDDRTLRIREERFSLDSFKRIRVIGFGKSSCAAAVALEKKLGSVINDGMVIDIREAQCENIDTYQGTHPLPSKKNLRATGQMVELAGEVTQDDLVLVIVSGGGSALLCWPAQECTQGQMLYEEFLPTGGTIQELNTIRKHLSFLKGGGLAKLLYPATVVGLIFCDVPGNTHNDVASGPTYKDTSTVADAERIIQKYNLTGDYTLSETPKDDVFFEHVYNIPLVSNDTALSAMVSKAEELGCTAGVVSNQLYDFLPGVLNAFFTGEVAADVRVGGGEVRLKVKNENSSGSASPNTSRGGRNQYVALGALERVGTDDIFISIASDGKDNGPAAGAIADSITKKKAAELRLNPHRYINELRGYDFFKKTGDIIITGPTDANVADLFLLMRTAC